MREIKFRQWNSRHKSFQYGIGASPGCWTSPSEVVWDKYPLMQFTGLHDKNGKEIWENDLVKRRHNIFKVLWFDEGAGFIFQNIKDTDDCWCPNSYSTANEWEVIGNIYENPELLDGK